MALPPEEDWPSPEVLPEEAVTQPGVEPNRYPSHPVPEVEFDPDVEQPVPATERCPAPSLTPGPDWEEAPVGFDTEPPLGPEHDE